MADNRLDLPSGGWIDLRDPDTLRRGDRNRVRRAIKTDSTAGGVLVDTTDALAAVMISAWEIPYLPEAPLPSQAPGILDQLTVADSNALDKALEPANATLFPTPASPDQHADPESPSAPASGS